MQTIKGKGFSFPSWEEEWQINTEIKYYHYEQAMLYDFAMKFMLGVSEKSSIPLQSKYTLLWKIQEFGAVKLLEWHTHSLQFLWREQNLVVDSSSQKTWVGIIRPNGYEKQLDKF